jgi:hypothetical protein
LLFSKIPKRRRKTTNRSDNPEKDSSQEDGQNRSGSPIFSPNQSGSDSEDGGVLSGSGTLDRPPSPFTPSTPNDHDPFSVHSPPPTPSPQPNGGPERDFTKRLSGSGIPRLSPFANRQRSSPLIARGAERSPDPSGLKPHGYSKPTASSMRHAAIVKPVPPGRARKQNEMRTAHERRRSLQSDSMSSPMGSGSGSRHGSISPSPHDQDYPYEWDDEEALEIDPEGSLPDGSQISSKSGSHSHKQSSSVSVHSFGRSSSGRGSNRRDSVDETSFHPGLASPTLQTPDLHDALNALEAHFPGQDFGDMGSPLSDRGGSRLRHDSSRSTTSSNGSRPPSLFMGESFGSGGSQFGFRPETLYRPESGFFGASGTPPNASRPSSMVITDETRLANLTNQLSETSKKLASTQKTLENERANNERILEELNEKCEEVRVFRFLEGARRPVLI